MFVSVCIARSLVVVPKLIQITTDIGSSVWSLNYGMLDGSHRGRCDCYLSSFAYDASCLHRLSCAA